MQHLNVPYSVQIGSYRVCSKPVGCAKCSQKLQKVCRMALLMCVTNGQPYTTYKQLLSIWKCLHLYSTQFRLQSIYSTQVLMSGIFLLTFTPSLCMNNGYVKPCLSVQAPFCVCAPNDNGDCIIPNEPLNWCNVTRLPSLKPCLETRRLPGRDRHCTQTKASRIKDGSIVLGNTMPYYGPV